MLPLQRERIQALVGWVERSDTHQAVPPLSPPQSDLTPNRAILPPMKATADFIAHGLQQAEYALLNMRNLTGPIHPAP